MRSAPSRGCGVLPQHSACFLARFSDRPCDGPMDSAHVIPKQRIRRELKGEPRELVERVVWHPSVLILACRRHHGDLDVARSVRLTRADLPAAVEVFAEVMGLGWSLDRDYGPIATGGNR